MEFRELSWFDWFLVSVSVEIFIFGVYRNYRDFTEGR